MEFTYKNWVEEMEKEIAEGYRCGKCGKVFRHDGIEEEYAEDEICDC